MESFLSANVTIIEILWLSKNSKNQRKTKLSKKPPCGKSKFSRCSSIPTLWNSKKLSERKVSSIWSSSMFRITCWKSLRNLLMAYNLRPFGSSCTNYSKDWPICTHKIWSIEISSLKTYSSVIKSNLKFVTLDLPDC